MQLIKTISFSILSALLGALFLYSAYSKLFPIQTFEYTLVEFVHMPWWLAALSSRILVGLEAALGTLLVFNLFGGEKWVLKLSLLILAMFSIYLLYLWVSVGNNVNCGCFGDAIWMSPSSSLLKNAAMIIILVLLHKYHSGISKKWAKYVSIIGLVIITTVPLFVFPIPGTKPSFLNEDKYELDLSALYESDKRPEPEIELRKGKHIIAFMSLTCPHCKMAALKMQLMHRDNPDISMFFVLNGDSVDLKPFWEKTNAEEIPHTMLLGRDFVELSGLSLPAIYWINDGWVEARSTYINMNQGEIEKWLEDKKQ
ncbi:MAG: hypothetical protein KDC07_08930 [Chitinophagaceae bacterium]|nr:hypothetical protein [Chitinophagaceae bacterium]MCB9046025.1 hypothetical protein [Chitinophagales bacterium]